MRVVKFDGSNFTSYRKKDGLSCNDVVRIKEDSKGRIWIFNYNASVNYLYNNIVYNDKNAPFLNSLMGNGFVLDFYTDSNRTIHFYNWQGDVFSLDTNNMVSKNILFKNSIAKLPLDDRDINRIKILYLSVNKSGEWIIWSSIGIYRQHMLQQSKLSVVDPDLRCMTVFPIGINTYYVITYYDGLIKVTGNFHKENFSLPFNQLKIKTILEDSDGYLWIAAYDEGVYCYKNNKVVRHFDIKDALGLLQDHEQNIWVSSQSDGIYVINHDILKQNHIDRTNFDNNGVNKLCDSPGTGIWCTNTKAAFLLKNNVFYKLSVPMEVQPVDILYMFRDQTLVLGSISHLLCTFENLSLKTASREIVTAREIFTLSLLRKLSMTVLEI
jgi:ligand-binding sensor domain-containing protein